MGVLAMVVHTGRLQAVELAAQAAKWLERRGYEIRVPEPDARGTPLAPWAWDPEKLVSGLDLALCFGGDGTMLRAVDLLAPYDVPILGVNVGHLGYLAEVEPAGLTDALERLLAGKYEIESRMLLAVDVDGSCAQGTHVALNEAVVEKTATGHTVRLSVSIDGRFFTTYAADGLIVATPTGSTAYALSARGPIVSPRQRALLVTPVAPHMLFDRTLVLDASESVRLEVIGGHSAVLVVDGKNLGVLQSGESINCRVCPHDARLVTFRRRDFHQILKTKFGLADR